MNQVRKADVDSERLLQRRCPRLGGPVTFRYCRTCSGDQKACWKIFDCWWEIFDVQRYLKDTLDGNEYQRLIETRQPQPKMASLLEIVQKTRKQQSSD
jgi:hypothetical protein